MSCRHVSLDLGNGQAVRAIVCDRTKPLRVHYAHGLASGVKEPAKEGVTGLSGICGRPASRITSDHWRVSCKACRKVLAMWKAAQP